MIEQTTWLKKAGLTEGEVKVYLALLDIGLSRSGLIVKKSGVAKSIIYPILERLMQKGLVSSVTKERTKYFQAGDPGKILEYIHEKKSELEEIEDEVRKILPELMLKQSLSGKSEVGLYLGFKGIRTANEHLYTVLHKGEEFVYLGIPAFQPEEQHFYWQRDYIRRVKAGIKCRLLFNEDTDKNVVINRNSYKNSEARYMPTNIKTPAAFLIYKNITTIILQSPKSIAVEITNQEIADSFKAYFDEFWERSNPIRK